MKQLSFVKASLIILTLSACSGQEIQSSQVSSSTNKNDNRDTTMQTATQPVTVAGTNLTFNCSVANTTMGNILTSLECLYAAANHEPITSHVEVLSVEKTLGTAAKPIQIPFSVKTNVSQNILVIPNLAIADFSTGTKLTIRYKLEQLEQSAMIILSQLYSQLMEANRSKLINKTSAAAQTGLSLTDIYNSEFESDSESNSVSDSPGDNTANPLAQNTY